MRRPVDKAATAATMTGSSRVERHDFHEAIKVRFLGRADIVGFFFYFRYVTKRDGDNVVVTYSTSCLYT